MSLSFSDVCEGRMTAQGPGWHVAAVSDPSRLYLLLRSACFAASHQFLVDHDGAPGTARRMRAQGLIVSSIAL